jgi:Tol biopolymer transport system component
MPMERAMVCKAPLLIALACMAAGLGCLSAATAADEPHIFAPGVVSGPGNDNCPSFTPDGNTVYFDEGSMILVSHRIHGEWTKPQLAPFSGAWADHDPAMAPDGSYIIYASNRPVDDGDKALDVTIKGKLFAGSGNNLWRVDRKGSGWAAPKHLPATVNANARTYAPSIAADGTLYFTRRDKSGASHIYRSFYRDGTYLPAEQVMLGDRASEAQDAGIAPDQSFIVFSTNEPGKSGLNDFYIAFRIDDHWSTPVDLGDAVNSKSGKWNQWGAHLSPDHRTLYYTSDRGAPRSYPRTPAQAQQQLEQALSWDNGGYHIWSISLSPWLDAHDSLEQTRS